MNAAPRGLESAGEVAKRLGFPARAVELAAPRPSVIITQLSTVEPLALDWLWERYIPAPMITIIDGDPGLGKSLLTIDLIARVTRGSAMPGELPTIAHEPRGAVLLSAEDDLARIIVPRLLAAGANLDLAVVVRMLERDGTTREPLICPDDLAAIEEAIAKVRAAIVVIDPLVAYLPANANANRDQDVRRSLSILADLGERSGASIVGVRHLRKAGADNALYRGGGSIGIIGAARAGLLVAPDPDDPTGQQRIIAVTKNNLGPPPPSLAFRLEVGPGEPQPHVIWLGETSHRAADLLAPADQGERGPLEEAKAFLRELLADGPVPVLDVLNEARAGGISKTTLDRAKRAVGVKSRRPEGLTKRWFWELPGPYIANDSRTSPDVGVDDVRGDLAMYGADRIAISPGDEAAAEAGSTVWHCPVGPDHKAATRPDGARYCGTCHP